MALIYEIIDTQGKIVPSDWKRLINFSLRNLDSISLIKNFLSNDNYIYSHPDNIKSKIIEKILDDSNLQDTINKRKQFWINTRIERFGKDCFMTRKNLNEIISEESNHLINDDITNNITNVSINGLDDSINNIVETTFEKNIYNDENNTEVINENNDNITNVSINPNPINPEEPLSNESTKSTEEIVPEEINENIPELDKEPEPNFNNTEFKYNDIIYNGLDDLMNNIDSDISREILVKTLTGKINKNYKKKYKEILMNLFIFKDNEWVCIV